MASRLKRPKLVLTLEHFETIEGTPHGVLTIEDKNSDFNRKYLGNFERLAARARDAITRFEKQEEQYAGTE